MKKYSIVSSFKNVSLFFTMVLSFLLAFIAPTGVFAASTITSVTLNSASTVTVPNSSTVTAKVNISYTNSITWKSTGWRISGTSGTLSCNSSTNFNNIGNGTDSSSFSINAPATAGTYNAYFNAYSSSNCTGTAIATETVTNAVTTTADVTAPIISQVTPVSTPTTDTTPNYTFTTNEAGTIIYGGDCSSFDTSASTGNNTIAFKTLALGTHSNCTIVVKDSSNNSSTPLSVSSFTIVAPTMPDLTVVKTNNVSGNATVGTPFNWTLTITNTGSASATFGNTNTILTDTMPSTGATYGVIATSTSGTTGSFGCSVASNTLTCSAKANVTIPAGGTITIVVPTTGTVAGSLVNPRTGTGTMCKVDPSSHVSESNENNNTCADTVTVANVVVPPPSDPVLFNKGMVTFSFDDSTAGQYTNGESILNAAGFKGTFYIIPAGVECNTESNGVFCDNFMNWSQVKSMYTAGNEIGAHTRTDPDNACPPPNQASNCGLKGLSFSDLLFQIDGLRLDLLKNIGAPINTFAYPEGQYDANVTAKVQSAGLVGARTVDFISLLGQPTYNTKITDRYKLSAAQVSLTTPISGTDPLPAGWQANWGTIESWIDGAIANKQWLILVFHKVDPACTGAGVPLPADEGGGSDPYCITPANFQTIVNYLQSKGTTVNVVTVAQGLAQMNNSPVSDGIAPVITQANITAVATSSAGASVAFSPVVTDNDTNLPAPLTPFCTISATELDPTYGVLYPIVVTSGTTFPIGVTTVICTAADTAGNLGTKTFTVTVSTNQAPVLQALNNQSVATGTPVTFTATATDPDVTDVLTYAISPLPAGATFDTSTGVFSWTPGDSDVGDHALTVSVSDGNGGTDSKNVTITVTAPTVVTPPTNHAPVANNQSVTMVEDTATTTTLIATDADNDALTYATTTNPTHGTLTGTLPTLTYTPNTDFVGTDSFNFTASDATSTSNVATVSITVNASSTPVTPTCPTNFTLDGNNICQPNTTAPVCPANTTLTDGMCVTAPTPATCSEGSTLTNNQCVTPDTTPSCPDTFTFDGTQCVSADPNVTPVPATCPATSTLTDSQCVTPDTTPVCPANTTLTDGNCVTAPVTPVCTTGFQLIGNLCTATTDTVAPVITLNGASTVNLTVGDVYSELGATALDNIDTTTPVTVGGDIVNTAVAGTYHVGYTAVDSSGNQAIPVIRTVIVSAPTPAPAPASSGGGGGGGGGGNGPIVGSTQSYGIVDFNAIIVNWGKTGFGLAGDLNNDGKVDILDFNLLLVNWAK